MRGMMNTTLNQFAPLMKSWRTRCGVSQLELSLRCEVSQKHISFLEQARNAPSKIMVLLICEALDVPLRDRNGLLLAAGFAPAYRESDLSAPELAAVDQALTMMMSQQEPYPAMVVDECYNVLRTNNGALKLMGLIYGVTRPEDFPADAGNLLRGLFAPDGYREHISNWSEIAPCILKRLQAEANGQGGKEELQELLEEFTGYPGIPEDWKQHVPGEWLAPVLTVDIAKDGVQLSFFSTIATLGTPQDVTLQEIRVESWFPADDATRRFFMDS
jgi:transcriptional regulator with XRE-family HTH domain